MRRPLKLIRDTIFGIWNVRELTWMLFVRDLKAQYRESYFGYLWLLAPPVMTMLVWVFLNAQRIVRVETEIPYPLFVLIGTTLWSSFAASVLAPLNAFNMGKPVFMKLKVPPEAFILSGFYRSLFDLGIKLLLLIPVFIIFKFTPPVTALLFPLGIIMLLSMAVAIGLVVIPLGALYGDVANAVSTFIGVLMYTAPIVFPVPAGDTLLSKIMKLNPVTPLVSFCREALTDGVITSHFAALGWFGLSLCVIFIAFVIQRVAMPHLVARMGM